MQKLSLSLISLSFLKGTSFPKTMSFPKIKSFPKTMSFPRKRESTSHNKLMGLFLLISVVFPGCQHRLTPSFTYPVRPPHNLSRIFSIYHEGIDFPKKTGHPVYSTAEGDVVYTGEQFSGYGKMIIIRHPHQWSSLYAHLSQIHVRTGQKVKKGQLIGKVGSTGRSSAPHLHFEMLYKKQPQNPVRFLPKK